LDVSAEEVEEDELGDDMLLLDVLLVLSAEPVAPGVVLPDVPEAPDGADEVSVDGVVEDDEDDDDGVDGLFVLVLDDELGGVLGVVVVDELELDGGVVGEVVVVVLDSLLQPTRPIAAAMATMAKGLTFIRYPPKRIEGRDIATGHLAGSMPWVTPRAAGVPGRQNPFHVKALRSASAVGDTHARERRRPPAGDSPRALANTVGNNYRSRARRCSRPR
jgi:hypothetical protein